MLDSVSFHFQKIWKPSNSDNILCIVVVGDIYIRRFVNCTCIIKEIIKEDLPVQAHLVLTSKKHVVIVNADRLLLEPIYIKQNATWFSQCIIVDPRYNFDPLGQMFRTLCTVMGYYKPPSGCRYLLNAFCHGCWEAELNTGPENVVFLPCGNPYHVLCLQCAANPKIASCPYEECLLKNISFRDLETDLQNASPF